ncbi:MAG: type II secretion system F family protein [Deltaproteobacteria bacterium]|nr:type II secretion system F family protein [Deltaproteobacteria bacterium]
MDIIIVISVVLVILMGVVVVLLVKGNRPKTTGSHLRFMLASDELNREEKQQVAEEILTRTSRAKTKKKEDSLAVKLFKAGYYTDSDRAKFKRLQLISLFIGAPAIAIPAFILLTTPVLVIVGVVLGAFIGFAFPITRLDRAIAKREEEITYYLPLVIEEISIGVSSGLDIGPCLSQIIQMSKERNSPNPVIEMFMHVEKLIQAGLSLEDSLMEVAEAYGQREVKHAFMFLGQCSKHGGEVSRQLQDLADAVAMERQIVIEAKITALPVKATGPLAIVFMGFFIVLIGSIFLKVSDAFVTTGG